MTSRWRRWLRGWATTRVITQVNLRDGGFEIVDSEYRVDRTRRGPAFRMPKNVPDVVRAHGR